MYVNRDTSKWRFMVLILSGDWHPADDITIISLRSHHCKLQVLVYNILPPNTAITDYAIGLEKKEEEKSANGQFLVGAQEIA